MTEKRPTLTIKPKARSAASGQHKGGQNKGSQNKGSQGAQGRPAAPGRPQAPATRAAPPPPAPAPTPAARPTAQDEAPRLRQSHEIKTHVQLDYRPNLKTDSLAFALL